MEEKVAFKNLHSREYQGHKKKVHSVAWNCTGTKLASGSVDQTARVWHIEPHGHVRDGSSFNRSDGYPFAYAFRMGKAKDIELKGHTDSVDQLCWDPKHADLIATASGDKTVRLWDARSGKCSQQAELSGENINITYKPDGTHIAVGNRDDELNILDVRKFKPIHRRKFNYEDEWHFCYFNSAVESYTSFSGTVEVLAYPLLKPVDTLMAQTAGCYCIAIDDRKSNVHTGRTVHQIPGRAAMNSLEWNPKYNLLAYAGDDKNKYSADEGVFRIFGFESS
ncbi:THO complex subunit 3 [Hibiscus syriacus]|uniref:THO complex subunit 3 n=1 Tax=Hibiscus syriacus TaxID=106335 RepID=A0A6A3C3N8_HIBSY|nr:THO complex subunit 3 [Hibiscus syriacus]